MLKLKEILKNRQFNRSNETKVTIMCPNCGNSWETTVGEISWYHEVGNIVPTDCEACRTVKKNKRILNNNNDDSI